MAAKATHASSGRAEHSRTSCMRLTTKKVPENAAVKDRSGLPFGVVVQPFAPLPECPLDAAHELEAAEDVARCGECFGYVNGFCGFERDGWICILCGSFTYWSRANGRDGKPRYRRNARRNELPEIAQPEVELEVARDVITLDPRRPVGTAPVYVALVDLAAADDVLELVRSAILAAVEAVGPDALFGIVTFSDRVGLYDIQGAVPSVRHVAVSEDGPLIMPLEDALPLERLLAPVGKFKEELAAAVETLAPTVDDARRAAAAAMAGGATLGGEAEVVGGGRANGTEETGGGAGWIDGTGRSRTTTARGRRAFGPALEAVLTWLGAEGVNLGEQDAFGSGGDIHTSGRSPGDGGRAAGGPPGGVRNGRGGSSPGVQSRGSTHPSCRVLSFLAGLPDLGDGALTDARYRDEAEGLASHDPEVAAAAADALTLPQTDFYGDAGARAALAAIVVDVFALGGRDRYADLASIAPLPEQSGGTLYYYEQAGSGHASDAPLPRDVYRLLHGAPAAHHCTLRLRTSAEFEVARAYGGLIPDEKYEGLLHVMQCGPNDCFAFDFEFANGRTGFGQKGDCPPTMQLAFEYTVLLPLVETTTEMKNNEAGDDDEEGVVRSAGRSRRVVRFLRQRRRRICTQQSRVATGPKELFSAADPEVVVSVLAHKIFRAAAEASLSEGRLLLSDWLVILTSHYNHEMGLASFDADDDAPVDGAFADCVPLQALPRLVFALLRSPMLRPGGGVGPDARTHLRTLASRLDPPSLVRLLYPALSSYADPDTVAFPRHSLSRAALTMSGAPIFLLDALTVVVVFYAPAQPGSPQADLPFPPPQRSKLRAAVNAIREERGVTPRVVYVRGGADDPSPFDELLLEEHDVEGCDGMGFVGFLQQVEVQARQFMHEAQA